MVATAATIRMKPAASGVRSCRKPGNKVDNI
jgi:hypothetical protein